MMSRSPRHVPNMGRFERAIYAVSPGWAARRATSRMRVQALRSAYEAVESTRLRRQARDWGSGTAVAGAAQKPLRDMARQLDRNHDLARGVLNVMVRNIVGPTGIGVEPQPTKPDGSIHEGLAKQLADLHAQWRKAPEVTGEFNWSRAEQLLCRSWLRDGESLWQYLEGRVSFLTHATSVPLSLELMEVDKCAISTDDPRRGIIQGVECDAWGRPRAFLIYKHHPGDPYVGMVADIKRVSADKIDRLKLVDRIGQIHGVSMFASVLTRLDDLKDYEESERIAAKVAASMAAFIKKGTAEDYHSAQPDDNGNLPPERQMMLAPGMVFDNLLPGEDVGTIDTQRPNQNAATWRDGQLRAVAAGADAGYSSISRDYNGSYSSQRQELVEQDSAYKLMTHAFIDQCSRRVYHRFVQAALLSGQIRIPRGMTYEQLVNAVYVAPQMPWIDPVKEVKAFAALEDRAYISGAEIIRRRGANPADTVRAEQAWQQRLRESGIRTATTSEPATEEPT